VAARRYGCCRVADPVTTNPIRSVTDDSAAVVVSGSKSSVVLYAHVAGGEIEAVGEEKGVEPAGLGGLRMTDEPLPDTRGAVVDVGVAPWSRGPRVAEGEQVDLTRHRAPQVVSGFGTVDGSWPVGPSSVPPTAIRSPPTAISIQGQKPPRRTLGTIGPSGAVG
jgi:hypothetical protein